MKKLKMSMAFILILQLFHMNVSAAVLSNVEVASNPDGVVTVTGKVLAVRESSVEFYVTKKTVDTAFINDDNLKQNVIYLGKFDTDRDGSFHYHFKLPLSTATGIYTAHLSPVGGDAVNRDFKFASEADLAALLDGINHASKSNLITVILSNKENMLTDFTDFEKSGFNQSLFCDFVFMERPSAGFHDVAEFMKVWSRAVAAVTLLDNRTTVAEASDIILKYGADLGLDMTAYQLFTAGLKESFSKVVLSETFLSPGAFIEKYPKILMNAKVANVENKWSDLKRLLIVDYVSEYALPLNGEYSGLLNKDAVFQDMTGKDLSTIALVNTEFANSVNRQKQKETPVGNGDKISRPGGGGVISASKPADLVNQTALDHEGTAKFSDTGTVLWAEEAINSLSKAGIISGDGNGLFRPNDKITRAEFAKIVTIAFHIYEKYTDVTLSDADYDDWYHPYVISLYKKEIIKGISENYYGANEYLTKQDMVTILDRIRKYINLELSEGTEYDSYKDWDEISDYAAGSILTFQKAGIIRGDGTGNFFPKNCSTRAEVCKVVYQLIRYNEFVTLKERVK